MQAAKLRAPVLGWLIGGIVLGLVQTAAVAIKKPLGVSTQFVVADTQVLEAAAPDYVKDHPVISKKKYTSPGYGWWLALGLAVGSFGAALFTGRLRLTSMPAWWKANHGPGKGKRFLVAFVGGFLILLGARIAHGCTSGQFASGWAQLSVGALPFTIAMFGAGAVVARLLYPKTPDELTQDKE